MIEVQMNKPYVYQHIYQGEVFYVGVGTNGRVVDFGSERRGSRWKDFTSKSPKFEVKIIKYFNTIEEAKAFEKEEIKRLKPIANIVGTENKSLMKKKNKQAKRKASINIRIYKETHEKLRHYSERFGTNIPRTVDNALGLAVMFGKWDTDVTRLTAQSGSIQNPKGDK